MSNNRVQDARHRGLCLNKMLMLGVAAAIALMSGCASVPMADKGTLDVAKTVPAPEAGKAGVYVFRNSGVGQALKKDVLIDGECLGETANKVFFYTLVPGDREHTFSTESEFSPNDLKLVTASGQNYFIRQSIKMGVFVGGAKLEAVPEAEGRRQIASLKLAAHGTCSAKK
jgi:hypothetical protein